MDGVRIEGKIYSFNLITAKDSLSLSSSQAGVKVKAASKERAV